MVLMHLSDTPPRNHQVSGSEMLTNLKGGPYEQFSKWVTASGRMRKSPPTCRPPAGLKIATHGRYGKDGGGAITLAGIKRAASHANNGPCWSHVRTDARPWRITSGAR